MSVPIRSDAELLNLDYNEIDRLSEMDTARRNLLIYRQRQDGLKKIQVRLAIATAVLGAGTYWYGQSTDKSNKKNKKKRTTFQFLTTAAAGTATAMALFATLYFFKLREETQTMLENAQYRLDKLRLSSAT